MNLIDHPDGGGYQSIFENAMEGIFQSSIEGRFLKVNPAMARIFGYDSPEDMVKSVSKISESIHVDDTTRKRFVEELTKHDQVEGFETRNHRKDGTIIWTRTNARTVRDENGKILYFEGLLTDITERKRAENKFKHQLEELTILHNIAVAASSSKSLDELIKRATDTIYDTLHPDNCGVELVTEQGESYQAHPSYRGARIAEIRKSFPISKGIAGRVISTGIPVRLGDVTQDPVFIEATEDIHSELCVPIKIQERIIGAINIESKQTNAYDESDERLLNTIAGTMATAIEQLRLFETSQRQLKELSILNRVSLVSAAATSVDELIEKITQIIGESLYPDNFGVLLLNEEGTALHPHPSYRGITHGKFPIDIRLGHGVSGQVAASGKPLRIANVRNHNNYIEVTSQVRSELCVPIAHGERILGVINAESLKINTFTDDDEQWLVTIASTLATAIEKLRLLEAEKRQHQEESRRSQIIEAMANIANEFATAHEILPALDKITQRALGLLHASTVAIYLLQDDNQTVKVVTAQGTYREQLMSHTIQVGTGITGNIIATGKPEIVDNMLEDARRVRVPGTPEDDAQRDTIMSAPLILRGKTIGAINAWRQRSNGLFNESELNFLVSIAHQTSMSIESIRLFQETARRAQEAHAIAEVGRDISSTLQLDVVLERIAQYAKDLLRAETSAVYLSEEPLLRAIAAFGTDSSEIKNFPLRIGRGILGNIALQKSGEIVNYTIRDRRVIIVEGTEIDPNEHLMGVPVLSKDQLTGLLAVWRTGEGEEFKPSELDFLSSLAQQAAVAIENARLFEIEQRHFQEAETLRQAAEAITSTLDIQQVLDAILENLKRVVPFDSAGVFLIENDQVRLTACKGMPDNGSAIGQMFPANNALFLEIWQTGRPLILKDAQSDLRFEKWVIDQTHGWMGIPLIARGNIIGYITIDSLKIEAYQEHDATLAMTFAHQAAVAIENARLYERGEQQIRQLTVLRDIDSAISSSFDLRITLDLLIGYASRELNADAIAILLYSSDLKSLYLYTSTGFNNKEIKTGHHIRIGEGLAGQVVMQRKLVHIANLAITTESIPAPYAMSENFKSYFGIPLFSRGQIKGVMEVYTRQESYPPPDWLTFLQTLAGQAAIAIDNVQLFMNLQRTNQELMLAYDTTLAGWGRALEIRDKETHGHTDRVVELTLELARRMSIRGDELTNVMRGAMLHDIGKMGIPDSILHKPGPLTDEEWRIMRQHPQYAFDLMNPIPYLRQALEIPYGHHERWDGSGYPHGLKGEDIPLAARIFAVVDVWDALLFKRVYRDAWPEDKVIEYLKSTAGIELDPTIVEKFLELIEEKRNENQAG